jgi:hypothetical protein
MGGTGSCVVGGADVTGGTGVEEGVAAGGGAFGGAGLVVVLGEAGVVALVGSFASSFAGCVTSLTGSFLHDWRKVRVMMARMVVVFMAVFSRRGASSCLSLRIHASLRSRLNIKGQRRR